MQFTPGDYDTGRIEIDQSPATRRLLLSKLNDNIVQNIGRRASVTSYDTDNKIHKSEFSDAKTDKTIEELLARKSIDG